MSVLMGALVLGSVFAQQFVQIQESPPPPPIPHPQPIITAEPLRSEGPLARYAVEPSIAYAFLSGPDSVDNTGLITMQAALGPKQATGQLGEIAGWLNNYSLRIRFTLALPRDKSALGGPMTYAVQRYFPSNVLSIAPLLHFHVGIESGFSTPWISGQTQTPPQVLQVVNAVDTEIARNGWSIRPLAGYLRGDFLACRNVYAEAGAIPEIFVPTQPATATEYDLRFHVGVGFSFACAHRADSWLHHLAAAFEYRGRVRLYTTNLPVDHYDMASTSLQYDFWRFTLSGFVNFVPYSSGRKDYRAIGARLQLGFL